MLIENQTLVRIGIETILSKQPDIEIVGAAMTAEKGFEMFRAAQPDVTILSLRLPESCAVESLENYFGENVRARIIILAEHAGEAEISRTLKQGASGYVCIRDVTADELIEAIRRVAAGRKYIPGGIAEILSESYGREELTPTETRILQSIAAGQANKEIAYNLNVSENTVKTHVKNVFEKLGVSDRTSAATLAIKRGLVRLDV